MRSGKLPSRSDLDPKKLFVAIRVLLNQKIPPSEGRDVVGTFRHCKAMNAALLVVP
jgi:hypothetical protein